MSSKKISKCLRKQKVAGHKMLKDFNIRCTESLTENVAICNAGLVTGMSRETLKQLLDDINVIQNYDIIMPVAKSYSFVRFSSTEDAQKFFNSYNGSECVKSDGSPLYLSFTDSVPDSNQNSSEDLPDGLRLIHNFVTEEEAARLLNIVDWDGEIDNTSELKHRKAKHFGYIFRYDNNKVDLENHIEPIPAECDFLQQRFEQENCGFYVYDQLTINRYLPGQGIPPHIDTHSIFEDTILSLSLGSDCVMDFKKDDRKVSILLPQRSLLIMKDEARYAWSHGIGPRHSDIVSAQDGTTFQPRSTRVSFTFRKVRSGNCRCKYPKYCDTKVSCTEQLDAVHLENRYVHEVYEQISSHFSETRHKQWPNVTQFLNSLPLGSVLVDVGCGNGKYLVESSSLYKIGCDRSSNLIEISRQRGFEVIVADCLKLPYRDSSVDAAISIAVIHHLSTHERRKNAIEEISRILRPEGKMLIYVWAKSQKKDSVPSAYLKYSGARKSTTQKPDDDVNPTALPVHQNGTEFAHDDVFVPWKRKGGGEFLRYYHVFDEGELERLCSEVDQVAIERVYYDQGNWCAILKKT